MASRPDGEATVLLGCGVLGVGLGAVLDVLVFHLVLQWHHLLSATVPVDTLAGLRANVHFDGVFALAMLAVAGVGAALVWRGLNRAERPYPPVRALGGVLVGVGAFNVFDGVVDHYLLHVHDAVHGTRAFNPHWVGASLLLLGLGVLAATR